MEDAIENGKKYGDGMKDFYLGMKMEENARREDGKNVFHFTLSFPPDPALRHYN